MSLDEIAKLRARLREEIMEREVLLAALDVVEKYAARGHAPHSMELGNLVAALLPSRPPVELKEQPALAAPVPATPTAEALPPPPPVKPYMNPELQALQAHYATQTTAVRWAITKMTEDYSLHDLNALLEREGWHTDSASTSVVLSRLKRQGEVEEVQRGAGPHPAVYRAPARPETFGTESADAPDTFGTPSSLAIAS